ncbi:MAG: sugar phosphate isomerase/epimerase [Candidatus Sumerlaeota bacterium]|nr:sugar phosphate isomerase/epimerase [Candidatus Sumerlaeota bacterium]
MGRIPIAVQLYSVRHEFAADPRGTLKKVAAMGYEGVEFAGALAGDPKELHAMLKEFGLACCGWHTPFAAVQDDQFEATVAFFQALGNRRAIVPGIPGKLTDSREAWRKIAGVFNQLAEKLAAHGMVTGYHNHHAEFAPLEGEAPWDTFFSNTDKGVIMQLDTGNAASGGGDPVAILKRYPGRAGTVHLKPYCFALGKEERRNGFRPLIGEDDMPWKEIFALCETTGGTEWYIVEYESDAYPPLENVERCLKALKAMGK